MKLAPISLAVIAALGVSLSAPEKAKADDWGCQVMLCLASPGSPTMFSECIPPITKLWDVLDHGGGFPSCSGGGVGRITVGYDPRYSYGHGRFNRNYMVVTEYFDDGRIQRVYTNRFQLTAPISQTTSPNSSPINSNINGIVPAQE